MKKAKKILTLVACAVLLVCISVSATLAYLQSTTKVVENTFTVGNVTLNNELGNGLDEADVDEYGEIIKDANPERVLKNQYKLIANHTYIKDPTVHVAAGSEPCYVYVKVLNGIESIEASDIVDDPTTADVNEAKSITIASQMADKGWIAVPGVADVYYYDTNANDSVFGTIVNNLEGDKVLDIKVFDTFTIKADAEAADLEGYKNAQITIQAYALQADGFDDAVAAYTAAPCEWPANE